MHEGRSEEAERLFSQVFLNLQNAWGETSTFRRVAALGKRGAVERVRQANRGMVRRWLSDPELRGLFIDPEVAVSILGGPAVIEQSVTEREMQTFQTSVDHAALVFMHSALDAAVADLCRVIALLSPSDWEQFVENRKVPLREVKDLGYEQVLWGKIEAHLDALERESILSRADRIFALCQPESSVTIVKNFEYDRDRLELLDGFRHAVVHASRPLPEIGEIEPALKDLLNSGFHLFGLVNRSYGVKINPIHVFDEGTQDLIKTALAERGDMHEDD